MFDQIRGANIFSKFDLKSGYHQVRIKDEDIHNIVFQTRYGHYKFVVLPFGLTNTPTTFMCFMNTVLNKYFDKFVFIFIDDILIYSKDENEHEEHLILVLQTLREHQLYSKISKCEFFKRQIQYLVHIISDQGITIDPAKIKANGLYPNMSMTSSPLCVLHGNL